MKNIFIFFSLLNWNHVQGLSCYECSHLTSEEECLRSQPEVCGIDQEACLTEIRHLPNGRVSYRKSCFQENACINAERQNAHQCPEICATCCHGDLCNSGGSDSCDCGVHEHNTPTQSMRKTTPAPKCINKRKFPQILPTAPILLCQGAAHDSLSSCNSSIAYSSFADNDEFYITHASTNGEIIPCRVIKRIVGNETLGTSLYLNCVGKVIGKKKQDIQQKGNQVEKENNLIVACRLTNDAEEKEIYCDEKNYHCFVMYEIQPIKKSPPVTEEAESSFAVTKGILIGLGVLGGLFGLALAINFRKKLKSFFQNRVKPVEKQSLADKKVPSPLSTISS